MFPAWRPSSNDVVDGAILSAAGGLFPLLPNEGSADALRLRGDRGPDEKRLP